MLLTRVVPVAVAALAVAWPVWTQFARGRAEEAGLRLAERLHVEQRRFRDGEGQGGYAADLASLANRCGKAAGGPDLTDEAARIGYQVTVRPAPEARTMGTCGSANTTSDYLITLEPAGSRGAHRAYAVGPDGVVRVFFDGVAPDTADMGPGGLATPASELATFKIP